MSYMAEHALISSPAAEAWQVEFARMLPELERLSRYARSRSMHAARVCVHSSCADTAGYSLRDPRHPSSILRAVAADACNLYGCTICDQSHAAMLASQTCNINMQLCTPAEVASYVSASSYADYHHGHHAYSVYLLAALSYLHGPSEYCAPVSLMPKDWMQNSIPCCRNSS